MFCAQFNTEKDARKELLPVLKLALCDDSQEQRLIMQELLQEYMAKRPGLTCKIFIFDSGHKLLAAEEDEKFNIFILDIVMPQISGIDLGLKLREMESNGIIIYLTVSPEYAIDSYETHAFQYLMKPVQKDLLFQVLDKAIQKQENHRDNCMPIKTKEGLQLAPLDYIMYAELVERTIHYQLYDGKHLDSLTVRAPFQTETAPLLADPRFAQCSAGMLVNLYYVVAIEKNSLLLDTGERIALARTFAAQIRQRWSDYWLNTTNNRQL